MQRTSSRSRPTSRFDQASVEAADPDGTNPGAWALEAGFVSNGAYTLTGWEHNSSMTYEKNPNYHRADEVTIEKQEFMLSSDENAIFTAYNAGNLDFADSIPVAEIAGVQDTPDYHLIDTLGTYYVSFNVTSDLFADMTADEANTFRRALGLFVDRDYICTNIGQSGQVPADSFIPAGCLDGNGSEFKNTSYYSADPADYDANVEEGIAMLESIGYKFDENGMLSDETPISFEYIVNTPGSNVTIAEALQQDLSAVTAACMMVRRSLFEQLGGFTEQLAVAFNDVDFCLRAREIGYLVVYDPYVELYHYESKTRGAEDTQEKVRRFQTEIEYMRTRWISVLKNGDPYYNRNLSLKKWNYSLKG